MAEIGNENARTHGMFAIDRRGEAAMTSTQRSRYQELKELLSTEPGRDDYRQELAAMLAVIVEAGMSELHRLADEGQNIYGSNVLKTLAVYQNTLIRLLNSWPKDKNKPIDITSALYKGREDEQEN